MYFRTPAPCRFSERQTPDPPTLVCITCRTVDLQRAHERAHGQPQRPTFLARYATARMSPTDAASDRKWGIADDARGETKGLPFVRYLSFATAALARTASFDFSWSSVNGFLGLS